MVYDFMTRPGMGRPDPAVQGVGADASTQLPRRAMAKLGPPF